jgi:hypothetical protein
MTPMTPTRAKWELPRARDDCWPWESSCSASQGGTRGGRDETYPPPWQPRRPLTSRWSRPSRSNFSSGEKASGSSTCWGQRVRLGWAPQGMGQDRGRVGDNGGHPEGHERGSTGDRE